MRARHLAGVQAGGEGGPVRHPQDCLRGRPGAVVPRAPASDGDQADQHLHLSGEEHQPLRGHGEAGLQGAELPGVSGGSRLLLYTNPRPRSQPGETTQEEMSPPRQSK